MESVNFFDIRKGNGNDIDRPFWWCGWLFFPLSYESVNGGCFFGFVFFFFFASLGWWRKEYAISYSSLHGSQVIIYLEVFDGERNRNGIDPSCQESKMSRCQPLIFLKKRGSQCAVFALLSYFKFIPFRSPFSNLSLRSTGSRCLDSNLWIRDSKRPLSPSSDSI